MRITEIKTNINYNQMVEDIEAEIENIVQLDKEAYQLQLNTDNIAIKNIQNEILNKISEYEQQLQRVKRTLNIIDTKSKSLYDYVDILSQYEEE